VSFFRGDNVAGELLGSKVLPFTAKPWARHGPCTLRAKRERFTPAARRRSIPLISTKKYTPKGTLLRYPPDPPVARTAERLSYFCGQMNISTHPSKANAVAPFGAYIAHFYNEVFSHVIPIRSSPRHSQERSDAGISSTGS